MNISEELLGKFFIFDDRSVHLNNSNTVHSDSSNLMGLVNAKFGDYWRMSAYAEYDPHNNYGEKIKSDFLINDHMENRTRYSIPATGLQEELKKKLMCRVYYL